MKVNATYAKKTTVEQYTQEKATGQHFKEQKKFTEGGGVNNNNKKNFITKHM